MDIDYFYSEILKLLPFLGEKDEDFSVRLKKALQQYIDLAKVCGVDSEICDEISDICVKIKSLVHSSLKGLQSKAYIQLQNLIQGKSGDEPKVDLLNSLEIIPENHSFFRMREMKSVYRVSREDLFHIPLNERGIVQTQRYSTPGYPCLYLGESVYACWEEMRRPPMYSCAVSRFQNTNPLNLIDLRIPGKEKLTDARYLKLIPLIISCMIPVKKVEDTFKPEYIIPQLIIEWVLKYRNRRNIGVKIHGIVYTSTHINEEFGFAKEKCINYAIPVFRVTSHLKYCKELCSLFKLTKPTTNDLEQLKNQYDRIIIIDGGGAAGNRREIQNYKTSDFGNLEERLKSEDKFPLEFINYRGK